ncbi:hypothetical protein WSM22_44850 [Cytophagales bacterium WSM2-2]|nr:hypothetical protein WSM22_44850 [Cytophagales bacterium WSM2-2]
MLAISVAVVIMVLILWEDFLFPAKIKPMEDVVVFRNHRTKLKTQILIYFAIPVIFVVIYLNYEVNHVRFFIWAAICTIAPVAGRLISGIKNYNDFLKLTNEAIQYKNNEEEGVLQVKDIREIKLIKDDNNVLHKVEVAMHNNTVMIDLDEMELEAYYHTIEEFISGHYKALVK